MTQEGGGCGAPGKDPATFSHLMPPSWLQESGELGTFGTGHVRKGSLSGKGLARFGIWAPAAFGTACSVFSVTDSALKLRCRIRLMTG